MNKTLLLGASLWFAALHVPPALAQVAAAKMLPARSEVAFVSKQMGVPVDGHFKKFDAQIQLDPRKPASGSIAFQVDTASATLGSPEPDAEMPKPLWFNVAKFPQASFKSSSIKAAGGGKFEVAGQLQIKGKSRDIVVPVQIVQAGAESTASGSFVIKRLDFGIGEGEWADTSVVANDVTVKFKLALNGLGPL
jgi:polyisoprenoid-binding protein YceI